MQLAEQPVKIQFHGTAAAGTGPDLTGYPHLTYAPAQWGEGVRCASNGAAVDDIFGPYDDRLPDLGAIAAIYGITLAELFDAARYAVANGTR